MRRGSEPPKASAQPEWTREDIPSQAGRNAIVTGGGRGLGLIVARELARAGGDVVLAVRSPERARTGVEAIRAVASSSRVEAETLDLADLDSIRAFANRWHEGGDSVDLLINGAGVMATPHARTADGFELQLGTNHLGHFALTGLLLDRIRDVPNARVVTISSLQHRRSAINFDDLQSERHYRRWRAYNQSKLANLLFAFELDRRLRAVSAAAGSIAAHPGVSFTDLQRSLAHAPERLFISTMVRLGGHPVERAALPILYAATAPEVEGAYIGPTGPGERRGPPGPAQPAAAARDRETAARLWRISEELTGVTFPLDPGTAHTQAAPGTSVEEVRR